MLESVGVVKDPASVLYGQGAIGGIVNVNSKLPKQDFTREVNPQYREYVTAWQGNIVIDTLVAWEAGTVFSSGSFGVHFVGDPSAGKD